MKQKKVLCVLMAAVMTMGMFAGCGSTETKEKESTSTESGSDEAESEGESETASGATFERDEDGLPDLKGEKITIWHAMTGTNAQATSDLGEYKAIQALEEKLNCEIEFIHPPVGQEQDNFTILMADSELPDMIFCGGIDKYYPGGVEMAYEDGVLYDYTDLISEDLTPNFYKKMQESAEVKKMVCDDEGRIIRLGAKFAGSEEADLTYNGLLIRSDYLEQAGMEIPTTISEWTELFAKMQENGVKYPLSLAGDNGMGGLFSSNVFSSAYGISAGDFYKDENGKIAYGPYQDAYKDYLAKLNEWFEAGYINPDFTIQKESDVMSQAADDKVGSMFMHLYTYGAEYYMTTEKDNPEKALVPAPIPTLNEGDELPGLRESSIYLGDYKYITADAKNPEACMALLDALYNEDIDCMMNNGIEGVTYDMEDGVPVRRTISSDADKETVLSMWPEQWATTEDNDLDYILTRKYNKGAQDEALTLWKEQGTDQMLSKFILLNTEESEIKTSYQTDIETYVKEMALKFIMGQESLDNFETYQENLKNMHIEDLIDIYQAATDRVDAR